MGLGAHLVVAWQVARSSGRTPFAVGALRLNAREIVQGLAVIDEFPLHSRAEKATIAIIIQADAMERTGRHR
jgi:N-acetylmuramic acid 6-phosphate (MurNAc-6-P) etherase